jgi:hypothetical protein
LANGHDVTIRHNDVTDGYHGGLSVCLMGCVPHNANGLKIAAEYNHIWNVMQGVTSNGGAIYFSVGSPSGTGADNRIVSNLVHDVTDSSVIDSGVAGYGFGGHGIQLDNLSAAIHIENNVVFRVTDSTVALSKGAPQGYPDNSFRNNIFSAGRKPNPDCGPTSIDPGAGKTHTAKDYLMTKNPVADFDFTKTNETIQKAGRSHPSIVPPAVPPTFPTFSLKEF